MRGKGRERALKRTIPERYALAMRELVGEPPHRVVVALSGGADSTALLAAAVSATAVAATTGVTHVATGGIGTAPGGDGVPASPGIVTACLVDHGARGEEDARAESFCGVLCERLGVALVVERIEVRPAGRGWEDAARTERYAALERARVAARADWVLVGHTADDAAETMLWRLARGAAARGLGGIPERRGTVLRPLLGLRRTELRRWLRELPELGELAVSTGSGDPWLEDSTNTDARFLRNRVRGEVLPALEDIVPQAVDSMATAGRLLREDDEYLEGRAREALARARVGPPELAHAVKKGLRLMPGALAFRAPRLRVEPGPVARRAVRSALIEAGVPGDELESRHVILVLAGLAEPGFVAELPGDVRASVKRDLLLLETTLS